MTIRDPLNGNTAAVNKDRQVFTSSITLPRQHYISKVLENNYQIIGETVIVGGTNTVLHLVNTSASDTFSISYIRLQYVSGSGGTVLPDSGNYFRIVKNLDYVSGGDTVSVFNTFIGSTKTPSYLAYENNPVLSGTPIVGDKFFPEKSGDKEKYSKEGSVVIPPGGSLTIQYVGDQTSGFVYSRISFFVADINSLKVS